MSAAYEIVRFELLNRIQSAAVALHAEDASLHEDDVPSIESDLPFMLVALEEVRVKFGVMHGEVMQSSHDLVEGDAWSLMGVANMTPADMRIDGGQLRVLLSSNVDVGRRTFVVGTPVDLTLMSDCGKTLQCQHIEEAGDVSSGRSFLLLPAGVDVQASYELISKAA